MWIYVDQVKYINAKMVNGQELCSNRMRPRRVRGEGQNGKNLKSSGQEGEVGKARMQSVRGESMKTRDGPTQPL